MEGSAYCSLEAKHLSYVRIDVKPGFPVFDRLAADRGDREAAKGCKDSADAGWENLSDMRGGTRLLE
jgi:hypothetical protein